MGSRTSTETGSPAWFAHVTLIVAWLIRAGLPSAVAAACCTASAVAPGSVAVRQAACAAATTRWLASHNMLNSARAIRSPKAMGTSKISSVESTAPRRDQRHRQRPFGRQVQARPEPEQHGREDRAGGDGPLEHRDPEGLRTHPHQAPELQPHPDRDADPAEAQHDERGEVEHVALAEHATGVRPEQHAEDEVLAAAHHEVPPLEPAEAGMRGDVAQDDERDEEEAAGH